MATSEDRTMSRKTYLTLAIAARVLTDLPLLGMFALIHFGWRGDGSGEDALWNAGAFVAWAFLHSLLAREAARRTLSRLVGRDLVRLAYVVVAGVTLALLLLVWRPVTGELWHATGAVAWALSALYVASLVSLVYITTRFDYEEFLGLRQLRSRLTGQPPAPPALSVAGAYGYCRHPMYLAMLAAFWVGPVMSHGRLEFVGSPRSTSSSGCDSRKATCGGSWGRNTTSTARTCPCSSRA
jgi:protein-S-isoprenylcysteine O-methyltransferase Ste14